MFNSESKNAREQIRAARPGRGPGRPTGIPGPAVAGLVRYQAAFAIVKLFPDAETGFDHQQQHGVAAVFVRAAAERETQRGGDFGWVRPAGGTRLN